MRRILVTRPAAQARDWVQRLREHGFDAVALPLIGIAPPPDRAAVQQAWTTLAGCDLVMFVSPNAVDQFFALRPPGCDWPAGTRAASPGPGTDAVLERHGIPAQRRVMPAADAAQFDSEALWQRLGREDWRGRRVLIVRGDGGREWLSERLREAGAEVCRLAAYARGVPVLDAAGEALLRAALADPAGHLWFFSSSEAIDHLETLAAARGLAPDWKPALALATHPRIAARANQLGCGEVIASRPTPEAVMAALAGAGLAGTPPARAS